MAPGPETPSLRRALGKWDLTAIGVNQVIGSAIFLLPSDVAVRVGAWVPIAFLGVGLLSLSIALCFAETGSRFDRTGGPILPARAAFGRLLPGLEIRVLNLRVAVIGLRPQLDLAALAPPARGGEARTGMRRVRFSGAWRETAIYARDRLTAADHVVGPAVIEQSDTTIIVEPGQSAQVDGFGNLILRSA